LIPRDVQEEIDRHKQDGNNRRAKRARQANSFIKKIILSKENRLVIKESKPIVEISFAPPLNKDCELPNVLDLSRPDDRIIAEMIKYKNSYPDDDIAIITHDTGHLLTAKRCNLSSYIIPDHWLLPPEPDSKDKKISELEKQIKEMQSCDPLIEVTSFDKHGNEINNIPIKMVRFRSLSEKEISELIEEVKRIYPLKIKSSMDDLTRLGTLQGMLSSTHKFVPPTKMMIEKYKNQSYPAWLEELKKYLMALPKKLEELTVRHSFSVHVSNNGTVPAENTIIEFEALGRIFLKSFSKSDDVSETKVACDFPSPPKPPNGHWIKQKNSIFGIMDDITKGYITPNNDQVFRNIPNRFLRNERDKNAFYWKNGKPSMPVKLWTFECQEFRHLSKPEQFDLTVVTPPVKENIGKCTLKCTVSAKNLPKPYVRCITLDITYVDGNSFNEAMNLILANTK
jgi:hypothetical protein